MEQIFKSELTFEKTRKQNKILIRLRSLSVSTATQDFAIINSRPLWKNCKKKKQARPDDHLSFWNKLKRATYCKIIANLARTLCFKMKTIWDYFRKRKTSRNFFDQTRVVKLAKTLCFKVLDCYIEWMFCLKNQNKLF